MRPWATDVWGTFEHYPFCSCCGSCKGSTKNSETLVIFLLIHWMVKHSLLMTPRPQWKVWMKIVNQVMTTVVKKYIKRDGGKTVMTIHTHDTYMGICLRLPTDWTYRPCITCPEEDDTRPICVFTNLPSYTRFSFSRKLVTEWRNMLHGHKQALSKVGHVQVICGSCFALRNVLLKLICQYICTLIIHRCIWLNRKTLGRVLRLFLPPEMVRCVLVVCLYFDARAMLSLNNIDLLFGLKHGCQASPSLSWLLWRSSAGCFDWLIKASDWFTHSCHVSSMRMIGFIVQNG